MVVFSESKLPLIRKWQIGPRCQNNVRFWCRMHFPRNKWKTFCQHCHSSSQKSEWKKLHSHVFRWDYLSTSIVLYYKIFFEILYRFLSCMFLSDWMRIILFSTHITSNAYWVCMNFLGYIFSSQTNTTVMQTQVFILVNDTQYK